jgi:triphosphoribosyl-dephospho-CoA synthase
MTIYDMMRAAVAIGPIFDAATTQPVGATILAAVEATRRAVGKNTNLGTLLLLGPLAAVSPQVLLREGIGASLRALTGDDAKSVYEAIRRARPGGLGKVAWGDVHRDPPGDLLSAMQAAAPRDLVARQYTNEFQEVLKGERLIRGGLDQGLPLPEAVVHAHLQLMAAYPDSLIARKCGTDIARQAADRAAHVMHAGPVGTEEYCRALADLDFWLRCDGHRRNPGTTADLIAAALFVGLRDQTIPAQIEEPG